MAPQLATVDVALNALVTTYKREKQREEASSCSSGSGTGDLYTSNWEYFTTMAFVDVTNNIDDSISTLDDNDQTTFSQPPQKRKRNPLSEEQAAKAELWKALAAKIGSSTSTSENLQPSNPISGMSSEEKLRILDHNPHNQT